MHMNTAKIWMCKNLKSITRCHTLSFSLALRERTPWAQPAIMAVAKKQAIHFTKDDEIRVLLHHFCTIFKKKTITRVEIVTKSKDYQTLTSIKGLFLRLRINKKNLRSLCTSDWNRVSNGSFVKKWWDSITGLLRWSRGSCTYFCKLDSEWHELCHSHLVSQLVHSSAKLSHRGSSTSRYLVK